MVDHKKLGKKQDFPRCAIDALAHIENLCTSKKNHERCLELVADAVFLEKRADARKGPIASLNVFQEFQLVLAFADFFSRPGPDVTKNAVFICLFGDAQLPPGRSRVLSRLISTAISDSIAPILCAAGTWMQQVGPSAMSCLELAQQLIEDFFMYQKTCCDQLKSLPMVTPRFAVNFMTSVCGLYFKENDGDTASPPDTLIDLFTEWLLESPHLCTEAQPALELLSGAIPMPLIPPIEGLISWCTLSPLFLPLPDLSYSKLHLALLQSLTQTSKNDQPTTDVPASSLNTVIDSIKGHAERNRHKGADAGHDDRMEMCLERFAQAIQASIISRVITGSIPQLVHRLQTLPSNTLMTMVVDNLKATYR